ncbi:MAG TPA: rhodanese-like domain-containing protein [Gemmatimonadaceae bacterium]
MQPLPAIARTSHFPFVSTVEGTVQHAPGFLAIIEATRARVREVTVAQARQRHAAGARLIDVREQSEWAAGHAAGAEYIGKGVIERDIEAKVPDQDAEIILYCGGGYRSVLAADALQQMGYSNVASMAGGWREWTASGAPTE